MIKIMVHPLQCNEHSGGCDQCEALMINGVYCHETGCPNSGKEYNSEEGRWDSVVDDEDVDVWDDWFERNQRTENEISERER